MSIASLQHRLFFKCFDFYDTILDTIKVEHDFYLLFINISEFQETFNIFDQKGDHKIQVTQIGEALRALGQNPTESDVKRLSHQHRPGNLFGHMCDSPKFMLFFFIVTFFKKLLFTNIHVA